MDGDGDDNWDLYAVVRGCQSSATRKPQETPIPVPQKVSVIDAFSTKYLQKDDSFKEMEELCMPFQFQFPEQLQSRVFAPSSPPSPSAAASVLAGLQSNQQMVFTQRPAQRAVTTAGHLTRSKRRKNQQKKVVCHVSVDGLSSDSWAWRKYGQKPIKGSPYPRGYYRCSSSKGCVARKQVERSRADPKTFIVTYTGEHSHAVPTHRNSLSGVARSKLVAGAGGEGGSGAGGSPTTPLKDEEGLLMIEEMEVEDFELVGEEDEE